MKPLLAIFLLLNLFTVDTVAEANVQKMCEAQAMLARSIVLQKKQGLAADDIASTLIAQLQDKNMDSQFIYHLDAIYRYDDPKDAYSQAFDTCVGLNSGMVLR